MPAKDNPLEQLNKILSKRKVDGTMSTLGYEESLISRVKTFLPSGLMTLDIVLGGGWPMGRVIEVFGHEASGKSMLAAMACAQVQKLGGIAVYMDVETSVDQDFFRALGVDLDKLFYINPTDLEDVFGILEGMFEFKSAHYGPEHPMVVVWDSVAATTNKDERQRAWEDKGYSTSAIYISAAFRKLKESFGLHNTLFFLINQTRSNVGVLFGDSTTTYGGSAIRFYSSTRIKLNEESKEKIGEKGAHKRVVGINLRAECVKNKVIAPYRHCLLPMQILNTSIDEAESVYTMMKDLGILQGGGGGNYQVQLGELGTVSFKKSDIPDLLDQYREQVYSTLNGAWLRIPVKGSDNGQQAE